MASRVWGITSLSGSDNYDGYVGNLSASGTHGGECLVTGSIEERYLLSGFEFYRICGYVLRYAACLASYDIRAADIVQKRCFTMIDVSHNGYYRRAAAQVFFIVRSFKYRFFEVGIDELYLITEFVGHNAQRFGIEPLVHGRHYTQLHAGRYHLCYRDIHHRSQFGNGDVFRHFLLSCFLRPRARLHAVLRPRRKMRFSLRYLAGLALSALGG